jgi:ADP-ribose pyrophosphatase YjhB (NUDIX family)
MVARPPLFYRGYVPTVLHACGIVIERTRALVVDEQGSWQFPGTVVDPLEDPRAAIVRALKEAGVTVAIGDVVEVTFHKRAATRATLLLFYEAMRIDASAPLPAPTAGRTLRWANAEEVELSDFPAECGVIVKKVIARLLSATWSS